MMLWNPSWLTVSNVVIKSIKNSQIFRYCLGYTSKSFQAVKNGACFLHLIQCDIMILEVPFPVSPGHPREDQGSYCQVLFHLKSLMWLTPYKVQRHNIHEHQSDKEVNAVMKLRGCCWIKYLTIFPSYQEGTEPHLFQLVENSNKLLKQRTCLVIMIQRYWACKLTYVLTVFDLWPWLAPYNQCFSTNHL